MGWRFRKRIKICKGLSLNINKDSVGLSVGTRGARYSINSKGRKTASVGIPGTGLYYTESSGTKKGNVNTNIKKEYSPFKIILALLTCGLSLLFVGLYKK